MTVLSSTRALPAPPVSDRFAWSLVDVALLAFSACTVAYEFVLLTRLPIWVWYPSTIATLAVLWLLNFRFAEYRNRPKKLDPSTVGLIVLALACALINVFTLRPDADDLSFFHRAAHGLLDLHAPISINHTAHDIKSLPAISPVHLTTSLEVVVALLAESSGIQPLFFYHQIVGFVALFLFAIAYFLMFRHLEFSPWASLAGVVLVVLVMGFSGDSHQDWGNFTLVRAWQGKCVLTAVLVPLSALLTFRFLGSGSSQDLLRLHLCAISGIGLSGTAFFLIPFIFAVSALAAAPYRQPQSRFLRNAMLLSSTLIAFVLLAFMIKVGFLPSLSNMEVWQLPPSSDIRPEWLMLERTIFVKKTTLWLYLVAVIGIMWARRNDSRIAPLALSTLIVCALVLTPPVSSMLIQITLPSSYWRLAYASQMPLIIALAVLLCAGCVTSFRGISRKAGALIAVCLAATLVVLKHPAINWHVIHAPQAYKFPFEHITFERLLASKVRFGAVAAIPEELTPAVGLLRPDIGLVSTRSPDTSHAFVNAGRKQEGELRLAAQRELTDCGVSGNLKKLLAETPALTVLVFPKACDHTQIAANISIDQNKWNITELNNYQLWVRNK